MGKAFICDTTKYELGGPDDDVIGLPIKIDGLPEKVTVNGVELMRRSAFHVSLVCIGKIAEKYPIEDQDFADTVVADFCTFLEHTPVDFAEFTGEYRFVEEGDRKSLVGMCDLIGLREFFIEMGDKYEIVVEYPPTHVTLFTLGGGPGIFLTNKADIETLTKVVDNPFGFELKPSAN